MSVPTTTGFSLEQAYEGLTAAAGHHSHDAGPSCRSPVYQGPNDSDDDGASDYASHGKQRLLRAHHSPGVSEHEHDEPEYFLQRFYETTVDAPCRQVACQGSIEEQLDLLTHCRRPMHFLSFFQEHQTNDAVGVEVLPAGAYVLPTFCEYCHAAHVSACQPGVCRRPTLYFQKKRPPFCKPDAQVWNSNTDDYILREAATTSPTTTQPSSWLSMFSHSDGGD